MIIYRNKKGLYSFICIITAMFLIPILPSHILAQTDWEVLLQEDFDDGIAQDWDLGDHWALINESGNYYLKGTAETYGGSAAFKNGWHWTDYSIECNIKFLKNPNLNINVRTSDDGRYAISLPNWGIHLFKEKPWGTGFDLAEYHEDFVPNEWYKVKIVCNIDSFKIYLNNDLKINIQDSNILTSGSISFETVNGTIVYVDNIVVTGKRLHKLPSFFWKKTGGPIGGLGYDIRIHPLHNEIMFVTDNPSGVNKSVDGGQTWYQKNTGISNSDDAVIPIFSLTIDPNNPDIVWAGTQSFCGIYKSYNCGETWEKRTNGILEGDEISFRGFAIRPGNSDIVLAAAEISSNQEGIGFNKTKGKIYKTVNGGQTWYPVWEGNNLARVLVFNPLHPDTVYCSTGIFDREAFNADEENGITGGEGILKSIDGGETWFNINNGIDNLFVGFLEMHPFNPQILYAASGNNAWATGPFSKDGGIYKTINGGTSWKKILSNDQFTVVTISRSNPNIVYAGSGSVFYRSNDGGVSWESFTNYISSTGTAWGPPGIRAGIPISAVVDYNNPMVIFVNSYGGGNFKSTNGAKTWLNSSKGYTGAEIRDISIHPENSSSVYAISKIGPFLSINGGNDWEGLSYGDANGLEWYSIAINPRNPNELLISLEMDGSIFKTTNKGYYWKKVYQHPSADGADPQKLFGFKAIAYAPSNPQVVYAGLSIAGNHGNLLQSKKGHGTCISVDGGETWSIKNNGIENENITYIVVHPNNPDIAYAATLLNGIYKTTDQGGTWTSINNGLPSANVQSLAIDPSNPNILFAGLGEGAGIAKTNNGGKLWEVSNKGIKIQCPSSLSPIGRPAIGLHFNELKLNFSNAYYSIPWTNIVDIIFNPSNPNMVFAADLNCGILISTDQGENWSLIDDGLSIKHVTCLTISNDGQTLYAGTSNRGVLRLLWGKNKPPQILSTIPSTIDTVTITYGDSLDFEAFVFDLNEDTLIYNWYLNDQKIKNENYSKYLLKTTRNQIGIHYLTLFVSDKDTTISVKWTINIRYPTFISNRYDSKLVSSFALFQNFPNPFNSQTKIKYQIPVNSNVKIKIFNLLGQEIITLIDDYNQVGYHEINWDGKNRNGSLVASGIYICHIDAKSLSQHYVQERKMVLIQ